jgi:hypothetical protein
VTKWIWGVALALELRKARLLKAVLLRVGLLNALILL